MTKKEWENCNTCRITHEQAERLIERFKQEKKIRIATIERCVMCGDIIPEGQQVCGICKHKTELEETINCRHYVPPWNVCIMKRTQGYFVVLEFEGESGKFREAFWPEQIIQKSISMFNKMK